jgi:hypothetical protein
MSFIDAPIPPLDHTPYAGGTPPGVTADLKAYNLSWRVLRPVIRPTTIVIHTNGGSGEGSYAGSIGWSNRSRNNTHAHYNLNDKNFGAKNLATNRRGIGNSTPKYQETALGVKDSSYWALVIETADRGYNNGGGADLGDFLYNHDELLCRILAYESIVWDIPLAVPSSWVDPGVVTHTSPWDGVFTIYTGKSCPGETKKDRVLRGNILPRAQKIRDAWTGETEQPLEIDMQVLKTPQRIYDTRQLGPISGIRTVEVPEALRSEALMVTVTAVTPSGKGFVAVGATDPQKGGGSCLNYRAENIANTTAVRLDNGSFKLFVSAPTHILVDVVGLL